MGTRVHDRRPLAIVPALAFLPAVKFLIVFPRVAHGRAIGLLVLLAIASYTGLFLALMTRKL